MVKVPMARAAKAPWPRAPEAKVLAASAQSEVEPPFRRQHFGTWGSILVRRVGQTLLACPGVRQQKCSRTKEEPAMQPVSILVVEDESIVAEDLRERLTKMGTTVLGPVSTGEQAVQVAEQAHPDLVLMDIRLQGRMDG